MFDFTKLTEASLVHLVDTEDKSNLISCLLLQGFDPESASTNNMFIKMYNGHDGLLIVPGKMKYKCVEPSNLISFPKLKFLSRNDIKPDYSFWRANIESLSIQYDKLLTEYERIESEQHKRKEELDNLLDRLNQKIPQSLTIERRVVKHELLWA